MPSVAAGRRPIPVKENPAEAQDTPTDPPNILLRCHGYHEAGGQTRRYDCVPNPRDNAGMETFVPAVGSPCNEGRVASGAHKSAALLVLLGRCRQAGAMRLSLTHRRWCLATACLLAAAGCGGGVPNAPSSVEPKLIEYTGSVFEPLGQGRDPRRWGAEGVTAVPGARLTIFGGQVNGWTTTTDAEGRFAFEDYPECAIEHPSEPIPMGRNVGVRVRASAECRSRVFRVEKAGYETRELKASDPYRYSNSRLLQYSTSEKHIPIGREFPADAQVQRMLRDLPAMDPVWLVEQPEHFGPGSYGGGVIVTRSLADLKTIGHEYCHAHQDWIRDPNRYGGNGSRWTEQTEEGQAFAAAWNADRPGKDPLLMFLGQIYSACFPCYSQYFADTCAYYFIEVPAGAVLDTINRQYLREHLPHVYAFHEEWLRHR